MLKYSDLAKNNIDLSSLGFSVKGEFYPYYCTPDKSTILGYSGVDGIHFCTVKKFGEMIFAVSPMNFGDCVHPLAKNFEDLIRLLLSVFDMTVIEQCYTLDKEQFFSLIYDFKPTDEQQNALESLQKNFKLTPIEDPYTYIKEIQSQFDYSEIPYTEDYYDAEMNPSVPQKEIKWEVRFGSGYFGSKSKKLPCTETPINRSFSWKGNNWLVPSLYVSSQGIVIDLCAEICTQDVKNFYEKWIPICTSDDNLSPDMQDLIDKENPLDIDFTPTLIFNGKETRASVGTSLYWLPKSCIPCGTQNQPEADLVVGHYSLDRSKAWSFHRWSFPISNAKRKPIKNLKLKLCSSPETFKGICFCSPKIGDVITFSHPINKTEHRLTVTEYRQAEFPSNAFNDKFEYPTHHTLMTYALTPDLSDVNFSLRDTENNDPPKREDVRQYEPEAKYDACIGIIGGADGPTALSVTNKKLHMAISSLSFSPRDNVEWQTVFREKTTPDIETELIQNQEEQKK